MASDKPFGIDPEDFERALREAGVEIGGLIGKAGEIIDRAGVNSLAGLLGQFVQPERGRATKVEEETTGETGSGVWAIYSLDEAGVALVEQVFPSELEALRAHRDNTDVRRRVRFLPYGVPVTALDGN
ncbi:hypothetical protein ACFVUS_04210 [Nocardia sp. NPDC058058]|uniref:hypothetical protein n=1 Tax=Nocardia sp. NPDC058058 TaxID=3346317 RepID=UPI0036DA43C1